MVSYAYCSNSFLPFLLPISRIVQQEQTDRLSYLEKWLFFFVDYIFYEVIHLRLPIMLSSFEPLITWRLAFSYLMIAIRTSLIDLGIHDVVVAELSSCLFPFLPLPRFLLRQTNWVPITFSLPSTSPVQNSSSCYWTLIVLTSLLVDLLYIAPLVSLIP
jgi:hypothetical protein